MLNRILLASGLVIGLSSTADAAASRTRAAASNAVQKQLASRTTNARKGVWNVRALGSSRTGKSWAVSAHMRAPQGKDPIAKLFYVSKSTGKVTTASKDLENKMQRKVALFARSQLGYNRGYKIVPGGVSGSYSRFQTNGGNFRYGIKKAGNQPGSLDRNVIVNALTMKIREGSTDRHLAKR